MDIIISPDQGTDAHLDFLREWNDETFVQVNDAVDVDFSARRTVRRRHRRFAVWREILCVSGCLLSETLQKLALHLGLGDEGLERGAIAVDDVGHELCWVLDEL